MEGVLPAWRTSFPTPEVRIDGQKASSSNRIVAIRGTSVLSADRKRPSCAAVSIRRENSTRVRVNRPLCRQLSDGRAMEVAWDARTVPGRDVFRLRGWLVLSAAAAFQDRVAPRKNEGRLWGAAAPLPMGSDVLLPSVAFFPLPTG